MSAHRVVIDFSSSGLSNFIKLGRYNYSRARDGLAPHAHTDQIEICYLARGKQIYYVQGEEYRLSGNDVFITFPGEVHSTGGFPEEKGVLYWMIFRIPEEEAGFLHYRGARARRIVKELQNMTSRHFEGTTDLQQYLDIVIACWEDDHDIMDEIVAGHNVLAFLLAIIRCSRNKTQNKKSVAIQKAISHVEQNWGEPVEVEDLARAAGLSTSWFKVKFKKETGITPADYVMRHKIERAKEYLATTEMNITDVAFSLAFSSSQYFATVFKRYTGCTPTEYRAS